MQNGNYMLKEDVLNYFKRIRSMRFMDINMAEHNDEYYENNMFYSTEDIKEILPAGLFREMECHVTTFMFINNK
jgi:hypothetical protein